MLKQREPRQAVSLGARLREYGAWSDIQIANISSRGLMGKASNPPQKGSYIELRRHAQVIVGRVVWQQGECFGVVCQDRIDIDSLKGSVGSQRKQAQSDQRKISRNVAAPMTMLSAEMRVEQSRHLASAFDFLIISLAAVTAAVLIVDAAQNAFSTPMDAVSTALARE